MDVTCAKPKPHLRHVTPQHVPVLYQPPSGELSHRSYQEHLVRTPQGSVVRVRVMVRRNAEPHKSAGQKVAKLEVLGRAKKQ